MTTFRLSTAACLLGAGLLGTPALAQDVAVPEPRVAQVRSHPGGAGYPEWAARWWQWAAETPRDINPVVDETGEHCQEGQVGGVSFLAGVFGTGEVTRRCTIPARTALFFPLVNQLSAAFLNDPEEERTEEFLRDQADCGEPAELLLLRVDGVRVRDLDELFVESVLFDIGLPEDNVFELTEEVVPELLLSPSVTAGYHVFLFPLPPGRHVVRWRASWCDIEQDVRYRLTVG